MEQIASSTIQQKDEPNGDLSTGTQLSDSTIESTYSASQYVNGALLGLRSSPDSLNSDIQQRQSWPGCNPGVVHFSNLQQPDVYPPLHSFHRRKPVDYFSGQPTTGTEAICTSSKAGLLSANDSLSSDSGDDDDISVVYYDAMEEPSTMTNSLDFTQNDNNIRTIEQSMGQPNDPTTLTTSLEPTCSTLRTLSSTLSSSLTSNSTSLSKMQPAAKKNVKLVFSCGQQSIQQQQKPASDIRKSSIETPQKALNIIKIPTTVEPISKSTPTESSQVSCQRKILPLPISLRKKRIQHPRQLQTQIIMPSQAHQSSLQQLMPISTEFTFKPPPMPSQEKKIKYVIPTRHTKEHDQPKMTIPININNSISKTSLPSTSNKTTQSNIPASENKHSTPRQSSSTSQKNKKGKATVSSPLFGEINKYNMNNDNKHTAYYYNGRQHSVDHSGSRPMVRRKINKSGHQKDNGLDLVTLPWMLDDDWICLFCQYEIFQHGWEVLLRKKRTRKQGKKEPSDCNEATSQQSVAKTKLTTTDH